MLLNVVEVVTLTTIYSTISKPKTNVCVS